MLDGYRLIRLIGRGGFGEVWLCRSEAMGDYRALKWIPSTSSDCLEKEYESLLHYRKAAAALRSPSLLAIEHVGRTDDALYYVMPLADGVTGTDPTDPGWTPLSLTEKLQEQVEAPDWFSSAEVIDLMLPVLDGLQLLSESGLVHRDVKPDNILFFHGRPCLGDISLLGEDAAVVTRRGTPGYVTPSWYLAGHPDMYGAAATLYSLLTGNAPDKMGRSAFLWPPRGESSLSESERAEWKRLHGVIRRAIEEKVSERFVDFAAMSNALSGKPEVPGPPRRKRLATAMAVGLILLALAAASTLFRDQEAEQPPTKAPPSEQPVALPELTSDEKADYQALAGMVLGYTQDGEYANALAAVEELLATYPQSRIQPGYSVARAMALQGLDRIEEAKEELRKDVNLSPNITAMSSRMDLWEELGDLEEAENDLSRVIDAFGPATFPLFLRADVRAQRDDFAGVQRDRESAYTMNTADSDQRKLVDAMWAPLETKYPGYDEFLRPGDSAPAESTENESSRQRDPAAPAAAPPTDVAKTAISRTPSTSAAFVPPEVDRSPRDTSKGNSLTEDSRLAYNSLAWFMAEDGRLSQTERKQLKRTLDRIDPLIRNEDNLEFNAAAGFVDSCMETIPALKRSSNARLAKLLLLYCDGDQDQAGTAESDPAFRALGSDSLAYRVELMNRLRMDPSPLLNQIISSSESSRVLLVQALVERARYELGYNGVEGARSDLETALSLSGENPSMHDWVEAEARELREPNPKLGQ